ncbi:mRNA interferase MazF [Enterococcus xiangfangensis]|nr:mRNA interferase MazF [Enterococcus xiangfangensis]
MTEERNYIPKKGDIVWINFDPSAGKEIQKRRPGLVVSRYEFNRKTMFAVICPITSTIKQLPTRYTLPDEAETTGQVLISQLKSLDFKERKLKKPKAYHLQIWPKLIKYNCVRGVDWIE